MLMYWDFSDFLPLRTPRPLALAYSINGLLGQEGDLSDALKEHCASSSFVVQSSTSTPNSRLCKVVRYESLSSALLSKGLLHQLSDFCQFAELQTLPE